MTKRAESEEEATREAIGAQDEGAKTRSPIETNQRGGHRYARGGGQDTVTKRGKSEGRPWVPKRRGSGHGDQKRRIGGEAMGTQEKGVRTR